MNKDTIRNEFCVANEKDTNQTDNKIVRVGKPIGDDFLLTKEDVASIARCGNDVARDLIKESSKGFKAHNRLYILDSDLFSYFKSMRGNL